MKHKGFTLIELMLALALGLFLMGILGSVYLNAERFYLKQKDLRSLQENARVLVYLFHDTLRMAGVKNCKTKPHESDLQIDWVHDHLMVMRCEEKKERNSYSNVEYFIQNHALYRKSKALEKSQKLIEGVQALRYQFGKQCRNGQGICEYLKANQVMDFKQIKSVLIEADLVSHELNKTWVFYVALPTIP